MPFEDESQFLDFARAMHVAEQGLSEFGAVRVEEAEIEGRIKSDCVVEKGTSDVKEEAIDEAE